MKKITLLLSSSFLFVVGMVYAQTISTGVVNLSSTDGLEMTAKIDVSPTDVTLTITGPENRWLAISLNGTMMGSSADVVLYDGVNFKSMRETSSKIESIKGVELVGVYDKEASESEIIEDCLCQLKSYQKKQKERDSLNEAMTSKKKAL